LNKDVIVLSLGGSVVLSDDVDHFFFDKLKTFIQKLSKEYRVYLIIGGGKTARTYIDIGRKQGFSESELDCLGILSTRLNASFLSTLLSSSNKLIPESVDEAVQTTDSIVVMGGTSPGHSTDFVGACIASKTNAKMYIIATNVDGVYDKDPRKHPDAKHLPEVSIDALLDEYGNSWNDAGKNMVIDGPALQQIKDFSIPTFVVDGRNINEINNIIKEKSFRGTIIKK